MAYKQKKTTQTYLMVGNKPWARRVFDEVVSKYPGQWHFVDSREKLTLENVCALSPRYIFLLHWSWRVPDELINAHECVCFHMTDLPYGRGGSPLQNLIIRGHRHTKLSALRMTHDFDAGPIYLKENLSLEGSAEEIYVRAAGLSAEMIKRIISEELQPLPQIGEVVVFKRRNPGQSEILEVDSLQTLYDFIRMLDAEVYPRAFIDHRGFRYEFSKATLCDGKIVADVTIAVSEKTKS